MGCVGWYWAKYGGAAGKSALDGGKLVLRCDCGAEYDFAYALGTHVQPNDDGRCGSCYVRLFPTVHRKALQQVPRPLCLDCEADAAPLMAVLQLLGYRRSTGKLSSVYRSWEPP